MDLPDGTHLAYVVRDEAKWWRQLEEAGSPIDRHRGIDILASYKDNGGGVAWELAVTDREIPAAEDALFVDVDCESWRAFTDLREFFDWLAKPGQPLTLLDIRQWLDRHGAVDETSR